METGDMVKTGLWDWACGGTRGKSEVIGQETENRNGLPWREGPEGRDGGTANVFS